jgi:hypothetical protein
MSSDMSLPVGALSEFPKGVQPVRPHRGGDQDRQGGNEVSVEPRKPNSRGSHLDILPGNNVPGNIWKLKDLSDKRNGVDKRFLPP